MTNHTTFWSIGGFFGFAFIGQIGFIGKMQKENWGTTLSWVQEENLRMHTTSADENSFYILQLYEKLEDPISLWLIQNLTQ